MADKIPVLFVEIGLVAGRLGARAINELPGCWEHQINKEWWVALNGHDTPTKSSHSDAEVPPFSAYIENNGWPAGVIDPRGGILLAGAEDDFLAALRGVCPESEGLENV